MTQSKVTAGGSRPLLSPIEDLRHLFEEDKIVCGLVFHNLPDKDIILDEIVRGYDIIVKCMKHSDVDYVRSLDYDVRYTEYYEGLENCDLILVENQSQAKDLKWFHFKGLILEYGVYKQLLDTV